MGTRGKPTWLSPGEFQALAQKHPTATRGLGVLKQYTHDETKALDDAERTVRWTITTGNVDRDRDVVTAGGVKTDSYLRNPIVLFAHDYTSLPVAKTTNLAQYGNKWSADAQFAPHDLYPFADTVFRMVKAGFLNASSIGFRPMEWAYNEERKGVDFMSIELLEWSVVPVPAHPEALVEARALGIDLAPLKQWAEQVLDAWDKEASAVVSRAQAEAVYRIGSGFVTLIEKPDDPPVTDENPSESGADPAAGETKHGPTDGEPMGKRGRVLSAANEKKLRDAHALIGEVCAQVDVPEEQDGIEVIANKAQEEVIVEVADAEPVELPEARPAKEILIDIDNDMLQTVLARVVASTLADTVRASTERAINAARGRVD